jgi:hypothetical protein
MLCRQNAKLNGKLSMQNKSSGPSMIWARSTDTHAFMREHAADEPRDSATRLLQHEGITHDHDAATLRSREGPATHRLRNALLHLRVTHIGVVDR